MTDKGKEIEKFIESLQNCTKVFKKPVENIYSSKKFIGAENNVNNLRLYLNKMFELKPKYMIVGEAPGYNGCRLTGIPFTSEEIISTNSFFTDKYKFGIPPQFGNPPQSEDTASIVWEFFAGKELPLMWNAFPFHPYKDKLESNRNKLIKDEIELGKCFLCKLLSIFNEIPRENIIAVGENAQHCLSLLFINEVRHPARGGKNEFIKGMTGFLK